MREHRADMEQDRDSTAGGGPAFSASAPSSSADERGEGDMARFSSENEVLRLERAELAAQLGVPDIHSWVVENSPDALIVVGGAGEMLFANTAAERLLGRDLVDLRHWPFGLPTAGRDAELELHAPERGVVVAEMRATPISLPSGQATLITLRDITEGRRMVQALREAREELETRVQERTRELRKANEQLLEEIAERVMAQEELKRSESRYRAILEDQTELICRYLPDGRLSYVNEAYARYYGKTRAELINRNFIPDIPAEDLRCILQKTGALSPQSPVTEFEHRIRMEDGSVRWQRWTHRAVFSAAGELAEYQAVGRDVTKRKEVEVELEEQRRFLRLIIDSLPNPIFVKDDQGRYALVNKAMAELYGSTPEEMIGREGADFNANLDELARFRKEDEMVLASGKILRVPQKTITSSTGEKRWFTKTKIPLPERRQVLGVAVDVTELLEAEMERLRMEKRMRQTQKMQALGTLAGGIAHDFNNMIYAMLGFTDLSLRKAQDPKLVEYLEQIKSAGIRASELVRQILTFSRQTEQGRARVRLSLLCKEVAKLLMPVLPADIEVELKIETERDLVQGDPVQIHQVLMNLCTNAMHAMRGRGGYLEIVLRDGAECPAQSAEPEGIAGHAAGDWLELVVRDSGTGMDPATMERIFDPFFTTKRIGEGTGMGLSVVHGVVQAHMGTVRVESEPGKGSAFYVCLPRLTDGEDECGDRCQLAPRGIERVLFVDDENLLAQMAGEMLSNLGYAVTSMTSATEALEIFKATPDSFDLVITDQAMPGMTGAELAVELLRIRPALPVILITGFSETVDEEEARRLGLRAFLMKPVSEAELARTIREALDVSTR
ncbi:PAS/PAC sensor hybrid histidine kinase [Alkalidesulfovibrio alkalitolerans DSM 16529]|uniref:histidine kinase n=2 Tax=Alkalidesulfovibrio alkalitolerans TaxID=293256 RepID=S7TDY3_9BACT|nr:PAS/PAC sensor hybrid histidine kinase [Alkalidesulfovibrio alkalitolerans DSM 16529]